MHVAGTLHNVLSWREGHPYCVYLQFHFGSGYSKRYHHQYRSSRTYPPLWLQFVARDLHGPFALQELLCIPYFTRIACIQPVIELSKVEGLAREETSRPQILVNANARVTSVVDTHTYWLPVCRRFNLVGLHRLEILYTAVSAIWGPPRCGDSLKLYFAIDTAVPLAK